MNGIAETTSLRGKRMIDAALSVLPWLGLGALIWYMAACVAADKKPKAAPTAALMLATWLLAMWAS